MKKLNFKATALAAALLATSGTASSAVVVGGDNGWEVSFGGTINLFMNFYDNEGGSSEVHLQEGLLPAFFTFKAVSPTINGLTGTAQISFAPDSSNSKTRRNDKGGSAIDMREVFFNVEGNFGTFSAGRTLGIFSRQAILKDQTLFGVGAGGNGDGSGTTLGRIAYGYVYPAFDTRFSYKTPDINGFQLEVGLYDPLEDDEGPLAGATTTSWETDMPRIEAEATYATNFSGGSVNFWLGFLWQQSDNVTLAVTPAELAANPGLMRLTSADIDHWGVDVGGQATFGGFEVVGHYTEGENLGQLFKIAAPINGLNDTEESHWYGQVGYTFAGATKLAASYGESEQEDNGTTVTNELITVGVYHDVNSWLKVAAEYNMQETETEVAGTSTTSNEGDTFGVGAFIFW